MVNIHWRQPSNNQDKRLIMEEMVALHHLMILLQLAAAAALVLKVLHWMEPTVAQVAEEDLLVL